MELGQIVGNITSPPILFFLLGAIATLLKSDLEIPQPIPKLLSMYLLWSIGLRGGAELHESGITVSIGLQLGAAMLLASIVPLYCYALLRRKLDRADAGAIAAAYGSISAVTFITAAAFLEKAEIDYGGHMVAAMALMESPAIIIGVLLVRRGNDQARGHAPGGGATLELIREAFLNGPVFLLIGSLIIGLIAGEDGWNAVKPLAYDPFVGVLSLFLLDMGLLAAQRLRELRSNGPFLIGFAIILPLANGLLGLALAWLAGAGPGDAILLAILSGSASYIAVPAAVRLAIPEANPSLYLPMALGITFPFNLVIGIPLYVFLVRIMW